MTPVLTVEKCLDLLEAVAGNRQGVGTRELARELGVNVTTVHNIARTLAARGYLQQDAERKFVLGRRLHLLARAAGMPQELSEIARPMVQRAAEITGETAMLGAFEGGKVACLVQVTSRQALCVREDDLGGHAHCTATGKMLLAGLAPAALEEFLKRGTLERHTPRTLVSEQSLKQELERTRKLGYAVVCDELAEGVSAVAVNVDGPWGQAAAALGVSAPTQRFSAAQQGKAVATLHKLAAEISKAWGSTPLRSQE